MLASALTSSPSLASKTNTPLSLLVAASSPAAVSSPSATSSSVFALSKLLASVFCHALALTVASSLSKALSIKERSNSCAVLPVSIISFGFSSNVTKVMVASCVFAKAPTTFSPS